MALSIEPKPGWHEVLIQLTVSPFEHANGEQLEVLLTYGASSTQVKQVKIQEKY